MAGNYPDVPSWRMAYDRDGTQAFMLSPTATSVDSEATSTNLRDLNDELGATTAWFAGDTSWLCFIFPELRDLDALTWQSASTDPNQTWVVQTSSDTTNGVDGTWTAAGYAYAVGAGNNKVVLRTSISSGTALGIKAVRMQFGGGGAAGNAYPGTVHLYGEHVAGENPHRLQIVKSAVDQRVDPAEFDWGNVPRGSSADKTFRVKNLSPSQTAQSIRVAMEALTDTTPSVPGQHLLSHNGGSFLAQVNIGDLAPGALSNPITLRRVTPTNAALALWWMRVFAEADAWA